MRARGLAGHDAAFTRPRSVVRTRPSPLPAASNSASSRYVERGRFERDDTRAATRARLGVVRARPRPSCLRQTSSPRRPTPTVNNSASTTPATGFDAVLEPAFEFERDQADV